MNDEANLLKFFFENNIPPDATDELCRQGIDLVRAFETGFDLDEKDIIYKNDRRG